MKFATFEIVEDIVPVEDSDNILLARVQGWDVVIKKFRTGTWENGQIGEPEFQIGDLCVYIPIDTVVDITRRHFKFLKDGKIKTKKIRNVYSQGLLIAIKDLEYIEGFSDIPKEIEYDIGELLGVSKYEKEESINESTGGPVDSSGKRISVFPGFPSSIISKTDEDNLRTKKKTLKEFCGEIIYVTQKQDGSSMTAIWRSINQEEVTHNVFQLSKRNISLMKFVDDVEEYEISDAMVEYAKLNGLLTKFRGLNIAIQGEFCGPKINGNKLGLKEKHWYIFNIKNLDTNTYFSLDELSFFCQTNNLEMVPVLNTFLCDESHTVEFFQNLANEVKYGKAKGEGIVIRPIIPKFSQILGKSLSVKVINQNYKD